jgi:hypothetical protein
MVESDSGGSTSTTLWEWRCSATDELGLSISRSMVDKMRTNKNTRNEGDKRSVRGAAAEKKNEHLWRWEEKDGREGGGIGKLCRWRGLKSLRTVVRRAPGGAHDAVVLVDHL